MTFGLEDVPAIPNISTDGQLGRFVIANGMHEDVMAVPEQSLYLLDQQKIGRLQRENDGGVFIGRRYIAAGQYKMPEVYDGEHLPEPVPDESYVFALLISEAPENFAEETADSAEWIRFPMDKAFAVPTDAEGILMIIGRQSCDTRKMEGSELDVGNSEFGGVEALVVFNDVFVPNERIFLNGETEYAGVLVERFAGYHRQSYGGCKAGVGDVLIGAAAVAADCNGCAKASHIKDKLIEMTHLNESLYCCGIACSAEGKPTEAGNYMIDLLLANVCKQNVTRFPYEISRLAEDIAGGIMVTAPSEADFRDPVTGPYVEKYLKGAKDVSVEDRIRILRLIENLCLGTAAVGYRTESLHGAGSPQAQRIMISRQGDLPKKKELAKKIAKIKD